MIWDHDDVMLELDNDDISNEQWHRIVEETRGFDWRF